MKIGLIGAGKVGFTLGKYFREHGANVMGYFSRNPDSAKEAADFTGTKYFEFPGQLVSESDVLFLTVSDTAIKPVWDSLKTMTIQHKIICHCSGVLSSDVFDGIDGKGAYGYSVHPFFAISSKQTSYQAISQAFFTLEGNEKHLFDLKKLIGQMGNPVHVITSDQKVKYHAAAVFLSNHVTALAHIGTKLLKDCGFEDEITKVALQTLFLSQCKAIAENGTVEALTGPVERGDLTTVQKHLDCLDRDERRLYRLLSMQLTEVAKEKHANYDASEMKKLMEELT